MKYSSLKKKEMEVDSEMLKFTDKLTKKSFSVESQPPACWDTYGIHSEQVWTCVWEPELGGVQGLGRGSPKEQVYRQTDMTENITFPQTTYAGGNDKCKK